jgi:hypothetical protein
VAKGPFVNGNLHAEIDGPEPDASATVKNPFVNRNLHAEYPFPAGRTRVSDRRKTPFVDGKLHAEKPVC